MSTTSWLCSSEKSSPRAVLVVLRWLLCNRRIAYLRACYFGRVFFGIVEKLSIVPVPGCEVLVTHRDCGWPSSSSTCACELVLTVGGSLSTITYLCGLTLYCTRALAIVVVGTRLWSISPGLHGVDENVPASSSCQVLCVLVAIVSECEVLLDANLCAFWLGMRDFQLVDGWGWWCAFGDGDSERKAVAAAVIYLFLLDPTM